MIDLIKSACHSLMDVQGLIQRGGTLLVCVILIYRDRTFAPAVAGAASMNYRRFVSCDVVGGASGSAV